MTEETYWHPKSLLGRLSRPSRERMLRLGSARMYSRGSALVRAGEPGTCVFLLLSGTVKILATSQDGRLTLLATRGPGDLVGELACLDDEPRSATALTDADTRARVITQREMLGFLQRDAAAALGISTSIVAKLRWATRRRIDFVKPVRLRLARAIYELTTLYGRRSGRGLVIDSLSQLDLAGLVGASEAAAQKAFRTLRERQIIETGHRRITVVDMPALERTVLGDCGRLSMRGRPGGGAD